LKVFIYLYKSTQRRKQSKTKSLGSPADAWFRRPRGAGRGGSAEATIGKVHKGFGSL
jgi:hypothetical protein